MGQKLQFWGSFLPFALGRYKGLVNGLVTEHVTEVILGIDWLVEHCTV